MGDPISLKQLAVLLSEARLKRQCHEILKRLSLQCAPFNGLENSLK